MVSKKITKPIKEETQPVTEETTQPVEETTQPIEEEPVKEEETKIVKEGKDKLKELAEEETKKVSKPDTEFVAEGIKIIESGAGEVKYNLKGFDATYRTKSPSKLRADDKKYVITKVW